MNNYRQLTENQVDNIFPPFSDKRRNIRKEWNKKPYVNWDRYLHNEALKQHETEFLIMKNNRVSISPLKYNYIIFDTESKTQTKVNATIDQIYYIQNELDGKSISPIEAMPIINYDEVNIAEFMPFPF